MVSRLFKNWLIHMHKINDSKISICSTGNECYIFDNNEIFTSYHANFHKYTINNPNIDNSCKIKSLISDHKCIYQIV